jgi:hypothetical protein
MATTSTLNKPAETAKPSLTDRCDHKDCNAAALFVAQLPSNNLTLMFCLHHGREHTPNLIAAQANISEYPVE